MRLTWKITKTKIRVQNVSYLLLHNLLTLSDHVECFAATLTKTEKLRNDLSVMTMCLVTLYVWRRTWGKEHSFDAAPGTSVWRLVPVSLLLLATNCPWKHCCVIYCIAGIDVWLNNTHRMRCSVSTATTVRRTRRNVTLHVHYHFCWVIITKKL
jgi:hypothetical protein